MDKQTVDPRILALCEKVTKKRPRTVIDHILAHGHITTEELQEPTAMTTLRAPLGTCERKACRWKLSES